MNSSFIPGALAVLAAGILSLSTASGQGRDNRWDTGVSGNGALGQAITLAGGGSVDVPPASDPVPVGSSESSSEDGSSSGSSSGSYGGGYSYGGGGLIAGPGGSSRFFGPGDDDVRMDYSDERIDAVHGFWYGIRGIGRGIGSAASWVGNGVASLFTPNNYIVSRGRAVAKDGTVYTVWKHKKHLGIRENGRRWCVRPAYEQIDLVGLRGAVAKIKGYYGMIDPTDGSKVLDFEYDKYRGAFYPDEAINFVVAFGKTGQNGRENWILALPDGQGGFTRSAEEYADAKVLADGASRYRVICEDHDGKLSMIGAYGQEILPPNFNYINPNGMVVSESNNDDTVAHYDIRTADEGKWGVADSKGNLIVAPTYEEVTSWKQYGYLCRYDFGNWKGYNLVGINGEEIVTGASEIRYSTWYAGDGESKIFLRVKDEEGNNYILNTKGDVLISDIPDNFDPDASLSYDERQLFASHLEKYTIYQQAMPRFF